MDGNALRLQQTVAPDDFLLVGTGDVIGKTKAETQTLLDINNVNNTADADKPVSNATITALNLKQNTLTFGKANGNALKSAEALAQNDFLFMGANNVIGLTLTETKTHLSINNIVYTIGNQSIAGVKTFTDNLKVDGRLGIGTGVGSAYKLAVNGQAHFGDSFDGTAYGQLQITSSGNQPGPNVQHYISMVRNGNKSSGIGYVNGTNKMYIKNEFYETSATTGIYIDTNKVGINKESPTVALDVDGNIACSGKMDVEGAIGCGSIKGGYGNGSDNFYLDNHIVTGEMFLNYNNNNNVRIYGKVSIGATSPSFPLHVTTSVAGNLRSARFYANSTSHGNAVQAHSTQYYNIGIKSIGGIWTNGVLWSASDYSDIRIKENIIDVPDDLSLQKLRDISCSYYEYKDKLKRGHEQVIGFIAQQVKEHLPMAVTTVSNIIPNEMRNLQDISWNGTDMSCDLTDVSGIKYCFYVSNDLSNNGEIRKEIIGNEDNTFTFDTSYNNVFCYGKEVDDFHILKKDKLFALNFSATQEIDRKVIALEEENKTLKERLEALEKRLSDAGL